MKLDLLFVSLNGITFHILAPLSLQVTPTRQRVDVGKVATISCDVIRGFPARKLIWLHNGEQIHAQIIDNRILQVTKKASGMSPKDKDMTIIQHALHRSFTSLSTTSTMVPLESTFNANLSANTILNSKQQNKERNAHILFEENGKVKVELWQFPNQLLVKIKYALINLEAVTTFIFIFSIETGDQISCEG